MAVEELLERVKLFCDFLELRFVLADDPWRGFFERLLCGDAVEPALLGELFVAGKIETHDETYLAICGNGVFGRLVNLCVGGLLLCFRFSRFRGGFGLFGFWRFRGLGGWLRAFFFLGFTAIEFVLQLFVEAEGLLPALQFVARQLGFLFLCAEVKEHVGVGHKMSLRRRGWQVKAGHTPQARACLA